MPDAGLCAEAANQRFATKADATRESDPTFIGSREAQQRKDRRD
jgi:hypothetical protein